MTCIKLAVLSVCGILVLYGSWWWITLNVTANKRLKLEGLNSYYYTVGEEDDISHLCVFGFFSFVMYWDQAQVFPNDKWWLGLCLGPIDSFGNVMAQWVLGPTIMPVPQKTICVLSEDEKVKPEIIKLNAELLQNAYRQFGECPPLCQNPSNNLDWVLLIILGTILSPLVNNMCKTIKSCTFLLYFSWSVFVSPNQSSIFLPSWASTVIHGAVPQIPKSPQVSIAVATLVSTAFLN